MSLFERVRKLSRSERGFTLVELLVVVAIIAILAAVLLPRLLGYTNNARVSRTMGDLASMRSIVEVYAADEGKGYYPAADNTADGGVAKVMQARGVAWAAQTNPVKDPWGTGYRYSTAANAANVANQHYLLQSAGPDRNFGTGDDVWATDSDAPAQGQPPAQSAENTAWGQPVASAQ